MNRNNRQLHKRTLEKYCAEHFIEWYNGKHGTRYQLVRAEEAFAEIASKTRWEFVARQSEKDPKWLAIEVKELLIANAHQLLKEWSELIKQVSADLDRRLKGRFTVIGSPGRVFKHQQWTRLRGAVVQAILDVGPSMSTGEEVDLHPKVLGQPLHWSFDTVLEMETGRHVIGRAHALRLKKVSDDGCSVQRAWRAPRSSYKEEVEDAVSRVFKLIGKGISKPNTQLKAARELGAEKTILVLESHVSWPVDTIKQAVASIDASLLSSIDSVYLVPPTRKENGVLQVNEIWQRKSNEL